MSASQIDARPHLDAVKVLLDAALSPHFAFVSDRVPGSERNAVETERTEPLPKMYVELSVTPRYVPPRGNVPRSTRGGWRVSTLCVGRSVKECLWVMSQVSEALRNQHLTVEGEQVGPFVFESSREPQWAKQRYAAPIAWTYSH